jgi:hypothetical protein
MCANLIPALKAVHARGAFSLRCCGSGSQVKSLWTCFPCWFALWIWTSGLVCLQVWLVPCCSCCLVPFTFCGPCLTCCCCLKRLATCMPSRHDEGAKVIVEICGLRASISGPPDRVAELVGYVSGFCPSRARSPSASVGSLSEAPETAASACSVWTWTWDQGPDCIYFPCLSCSALCPGVISPFWCHLVWPWPFFSCLDCWLLG